MTKENPIAQKRIIDIEVEVPGSLAEVWQAVATGPGISSWYVPHTVEERAGGAMSASFGDGPEMQVAGQVAAWEPPHRFSYHGGDPEQGLTFEWLIEQRGEGMCAVRLLNGGFGGTEYDAQYDAMYEGWKLFMANLRLHLEHYVGQTAIASLPMAMTTADSATTWTALTDRLGVSSKLAPGDLVEIGGDGVPTLRGTVVEGLRGGTQHALLVVDQPAAGTAFFGTERHEPYSGISIWTYLYGDEGAEATERDKPIWQQLVNDLAEQLNSEPIG